MSLRKILQNRMESLDMICSNSHPSKQVLDEIKSNCAYLHQNIYFEGFVGERYYAGCEEVDRMEQLIEKTYRKLFGYKHVYSQVLSGSIANNIILNAVLRPNDKVLSLSLSDGGHLTHTLVNSSNKKFQISHYETENNGMICLQKIEEAVRDIRPNLLIAGFSCYCYRIDHRSIKEICKKYNVVYLADISHTAGFYATGLFDPVSPHADIVMCTHHKSLRGGKGAAIMTNCDSLSSKIKREIFPKTQGGTSFSSLVINYLNSSYLETVACKKVLSETLVNTKVLQSTLQEKLQMGSERTENHTCLIDLSQNINPAKAVVSTLEAIGIQTSISTVKGNRGFSNPTGIRLGGTCLTSRGITKEQINEVANIITDVCLIPHDKINKEDLRKRVLKVSKNLLDLDNCL